MNKTDDHHGAWFFENRRKFLDKLVGEIEDLCNRPTIIRRARLPIDVPILLYQLIYIVKLDNDLIETLAKWGTDRQKILEGLISRVFSLTREIYEIKGQDTSKLDADFQKLKDEVEQLRQYQPTLELMESMVPYLQDAIERVRRWREDNR